MTNANDEEQTRHVRSSPMAELLGVGLAVVLMGGLLCFDDSEAGMAGRVPAAPPPAATLDGSGYEALRDAIAAQPALVPIVRSALQDGRIDVDEMDRIAPDAVRHRTTLDADAARRDMTDTLEAMEMRR